MTHFIRFNFLFLLLLITAQSTRADSGTGTVGGDQIVSPSSSVSTSTTGGTNINYQTNNSYNNEFGFAPGIFCRTPTLFVGGSSGINKSFTEDDPWSQTNNNNSSFNWQNNTNYNAQIGLVYPFGSSVIEDCKTLTRQITLDRRISTELSLIRTCAALEKEGLTVDPEKFPLLKICIKSQKSQSVSRVPSSQSQPAPIKVPLTTRY